MNIYFCSDYPCAVKVNGTFFSKTYQDILPCKLDEDSFIEVCSLSQGENNKNFFLGKDFFSSPPTFASVTDLKGGYLIKFNAKRGESEFRVIYQERLENSLVTAFNENGYKISLETRNSFFAENIDFAFSSVSAKEYFLNGKNILAVFFTGQINVLKIYLLSNEIIKIFDRVVSEYSISGTLITKEEYKDIKKHFVTCEWQLNGDNFSLKSKTAEPRKQIKKEKLPDLLIPYLFLEDFTAGEDFSEYLSDDINKNADKLGGFFGNFLGVFPPPLFRSQDEVGLIYKIKENLFETKYFTFHLDNKKISNIIPVE